MLKNLRLQELQNNETVYTYAFWRLEKAFSLDKIIYLFASWLLYVSLLYLKLVYFSEKLFYYVCYKI